MTVSPDAHPTPLRCPRCGGEMKKPAGSSFYWHASPHHPPCTITNIPDPHTTLPPHALRHR